MLAKKKEKMRAVVLGSHKTKLTNFAFVTFFQLKHF